MTDSKRAGGRVLSDRTSVNGNMNFMKSFTCNLFWILCLIWLGGPFAPPQAAAQSADIYPVPDNYRVTGVPPIRRSEVAHLFYESSEIKNNLIYDVDGRNRRMLVTDATNHVYLLGGPMAQPVKLFEKVIPAAIKFNPAGTQAAYNTDSEDEDNYQLYVYDFKEKAARKLAGLTGKDESIESFVWDRKGDALFYVRVDYDRKSSRICRHDFSSEKCYEADLQGIWNVLDQSGDKVLLKYWKAASSQYLYVYDLRAERLVALDEKGNNRRAAIAGERVIWTSEGNELCRTDPCLLSSDLTKPNPEAVSLPGDLTSVSDIKASPNGKKLLVQGTAGGADFLRVFALKGNRIDKEAPGFIWGTHVIWNTRWLSDAEIAYTLESVATPASIHSYNLETKKATRWTKERLPASLENKARGPEMLKWKSFDGLEIHGYITRPAKADGKTPVLVFVHGGPQMVDKPDFNLQDLRHISDLGFSVIHTNIRGSSGFGKNYMDADNSEKRGDAVKDVQALLDWIGKQPDLDPANVFLRGASYGGFVVLSTALQEPERVKGVIAEYPLVSITGLLRQDPNLEFNVDEYGDLKDVSLMAKLDALSPLRNTERWNNIPLFMTRGKLDRRNPESDVIDLKTELEKKGSKVWFIYSETAGHGFGGEYVSAAMHQFLKTNINRGEKK